MPADEITVARMCGVCGCEIDTFTVKKDNMMLMSKETVWCPVCQADRPEVRELAARRRSIEDEKKSYAPNRPADSATRQDQKV